VEQLREPGQDQGSEGRHQGPDFRSAKFTFIFGYDILLEEIKDSANVFVGDSTQATDDVGQALFRYHGPGNFRSLNLFFGLFVLGSTLFGFPELCVLILQDNSVFVFGKQGCIGLNDVAFTDIIRAQWGQAEPDGNRGWFRVAGCGKFDGVLVRPLKQRFRVKNPCLRQSAQQVSWFRNSPSTQISNA